jgi:hypothetical protein
MTVTVTSIDQGPFTATGLAQTVAYTFMTLTDEEISVFYDAGAGRVEVDASGYVVTRNRNVDASAKEGGSVALAVGSVPAGASIYLRANPRPDRDLVWSDTGSRLKNLNIENDRQVLRSLVDREVISRAVVVAPGQPIPDPRDVVSAFNKANKDLENTSVLYRGVTRPASELVVGGAVDATVPILKARVVPGWNGDDAPALNAVLASNRDVLLTPLVGQLFLKTTVYAPLANTRIASTGGLQSVPWVRDASHTGSTLVVGSADGTGPAAGSCHLENLWFVHPGRLGFVTMSQGGGDVALPNVLTGGQSHIEVHGPQNGYARVGGYGCPHFASTFGGAGMVWDNPFLFGGVWDPDNPLAQEGISQFRFTESPYFGHGTNHFLRTPHIYGGNATAQATATPGVTVPLRRSVTIGNKTVQVSRRIGPKYGVLIESCEDVEIAGGFSAGYAIANFAYIPVSSTSYTCNVIISGHKCDESNLYGFYASRTSAAFGRLDTLKIHDCTFNGQQIGERAVFIDGSTSLFPVQRLEIKNTVFRAYLSGVLKLTGVDGGELSGNTYAGYNGSANDTAAGGSTDTFAILIDGITRNMKIESEVFGGGINFDTETNTPDAYGLSPNGTQWGMIDGTSINNNNRYFRLRARKIGGVEAWGIPGGGVVLGGNADAAG